LGAQVRRAQPAVIETFGDRRIPQMVPQGPGRDPRKPRGQPPVKPLQVKESSDPHVMPSEDLPPVLLLPVLSGGVASGFRPVRYVLFSARSEPVGCQGKDPSQKFDLPIQSHRSGPVASLEGRCPCAVLGSAPPSPVCTLRSTICVAMGSPHRTPCQGQGRRQPAASHRLRPLRATATDTPVAGRQSAVRSAGGPTPHTRGLSGGFVIHTPSPFHRS